MADLQQYFEQFHDTIRLDYEMNLTLCEKKDIIVRRIQKHLKENKRPAFVELLQGSYKMKTGAVPTEGLEYDIDIGLRFYFRDTEYDAKTVRRWVFDAVDGHTDKVEEKGPCIRVTYANPANYHVDLVCYCVWTNDFGIEQYRLAHKTEGWCEADPPRLLDHVKDARKRFEHTKDSGSQTDQFRRTVRYLKRWNDVAIPTERRDKPTGLAFTLLCCERLQPRTALDGECDDRGSLATLARSCARQVGRIVAKKPTPAYEDLFSRLTDSEMTKLKGRFTTLADTLDEAAGEPDPVEACRLLQNVFGGDFPVPKPENTAKKSNAPAIISSSGSA